MANCPKCKGTETEVKDSRLKTIGEQKIIRRRRLCRGCDNRFTTYELSVEYLQHIKDMESGGYIGAFDALKKISKIIEKAT